MLDGLDVFECSEVGDSVVEYLSRREPVSSKQVSTWLRLERNCIIQINNKGKTEIPRKVFYLFVFNISYLEIF